MRGLLRESGGTALGAVSRLVTNVVAFDTCTHKYTKPCFQYLQSEFPDRLLMVEGLSASTLPQFKMQNNAQALWPESNPVSQKQGILPIKKRVLR